jgi:hypothetical protein
MAVFRILNLFSGTFILAFSLKVEEFSVPEDVRHLAFGKFAYMFIGCQSTDYVCKINDKLIN